MFEHRRTKNLMRKLSFVKLPQLENREEELKKKTIKRFSLSKLILK